MNDNDVSKWYNNIVLIDVLLFLMPPIGIIAVVLNTRLKNIWKVILVLLGMTNLTVIIIFLTGMHW